MFGSAKGSCCESEMPRADNFASADVYLFGAVQQNLIFFFLIIFFLLLYNNVCYIKWLALD